MEQYEIEEVLNANIEVREGTIFIATEEGFVPLPYDRKQELEANYPTYKRKKFIEDGKRYISSLLDSKAKEYGFDSMVSARSYAGYLNEYQQIAGELAQWGASVWKVVETNRDIISTTEDLVAIIPEFKGGK